MWINHVTTHSEAFPEFQVSSPETTTRPKNAAAQVWEWLLCFPLLSPSCLVVTAAAFKNAQIINIVFFKPTWPLGLSQHATARNLISFSTCQQGATESKKDLWFYKCPWKKDFNNKRVIVAAAPICGLNDQARYICRIQGWNRINKSASSSCFCSFTSPTRLPPTDHSRCQHVSESGSVGSPFLLTGSSSSPLSPKKQSSDCWSFHCNISDCVS